MLPPANDTQETSSRNPDPNHVQPDATPIHERLERIGTHLRRNTVSKNYGQDAGIKVADNIYKNYTQSAKAQDDLLKKASEEQRDVLESLSSTMIRFRKDEKADAKKFQQELLLVMQKTYAADGDETVKKYVEDEITKAMHEAEKFRGVRGSIHSWMTKDSEANKESWLFNKIAGTEKPADRLEIARNDGIAENEQNKLYDKIANHGIDRKRAATPEEDALKRIENLLRDLLGNRQTGAFPDKIDILNVNRLVVSTVDRAAAKAEPKTDVMGLPSSDVQPEPKARAPLAVPIEADDLIVDHHKPSKYKKSRNTDIEDVDFHEVEPKPKMVAYKPKTLALGYTPQPTPTPDAPMPVAPVKPKYQGPLKTQETRMTTAVRSVMNLDREHPLVRPSVAAAPVMKPVAIPHATSKPAALASIGDELSVPKMNQFDAQQDMSSSDVNVKHDVVPADVTPKDKDADDGPSLSDLTDLLPSKGRRAVRAKGAKAAGKLGKLGKLAKGAGKLVAVAAAGKSVFDGVSDEMNGGKVESLTDIVPKGDLLDKLNPAEYAMNAGRFAGDKINKGYGAVSKMFGGNGELGSDIYDAIHSSPKAKATPNTTGDQLAKSSGTLKAGQAAPAAQAPVVVHAPAPAAPPPAPDSPQLISGHARSRESYFDRQMEKTFIAL